LHDLSKVGQESNPFPDLRRKIMKKIILALLVPFLFVTTVGGALAADDLSPWQVRLRGLAVVPDESAETTVINGSVDIQNDYVPELDITYFLSDNLALELILGTTKHNVVATDTDLGDVPLGDVNLLPPTLTLQYHFNPHGKFRPYIGAGVNWTMFFDEDAAGGAVTTLEFDNSFGIALQAGVDIALDEHWMLNLDVKKIWLDTTAYANNGTIVSKVTVDPWIFGVGFGYRF
jgi:outer membrane protein